MSGSAAPPQLDGFVSRLLADRLAGSDPAPAVTVRGVVLFADIVDSTSMTDRVAAVGPDGAERLGGLLTSYFSAIIDTVTAHGGDVLRIDGDAVIALWHDDSAAAAHLQAARAALALRDVRHAWPVEPPQPLRHRLTLVAGTFHAAILSGNGRRSFQVFAGDPLRTIGAISHSGELGDVIVDGEMARRLAPFATLRPVAEPDAAAHGAARLDRLMAGAPPRGAVPGSAPAPRRVPQSVAAAFVPRVVVQRESSGLSAWLAEFRMLSMVYARLAEAGIQDTEAAAQLKTSFAVVARAAEAMGVEIFDVIADEKGVIAKIACGLPSFAAESNAARAVEIARRVRTDLAALGVPCPVGVSTGRAFCADVGNATRREYVLNGPVMNYGARLMQAAGADILCDTETAVAAAGRFAFSAPQDIAVRGRLRTLPVHRLLDAARTLSVSQAQATRLQGRDGELAQLTACLDTLRTGQGGLVGIEGEPGAGKSRLLAEFIADARQRGCAVVAASTDAIEQGSAYFAFRTVLRQVLRQADDPEDVPPSILRQRLLAALADSPLLPRAALMEDVMPLGFVDPGLAAQVRGAARQAGIADIVVALLARAAADRPLVLQVDDLHWIDALSADLLLAASRRLPHILIVAASRPADADAAPHAAQVLGHARLRLALLRLDAAATSQLACALLDVRAIPRRLEAFLHDQSEGLPFHAEQLVLALRENGLIEVADGRCRIVASDIATAAVPHRLRDIIVGRIDRLAPGDHLAVKVASVIGRFFELEALQAIYPIDVDAPTLQASAQRLTEAGFLVPVAGHAGAVYGFHHAIMREVIYELLSYAQRRPLHRLIATQIAARHADALQPHYAELAHHWELAADNDNALTYRLLAADLAISRYANHDALMHAERAERLSTRASHPLVPRQTGQLAYIRGEAFHALSRFPEAELHFRQCLQVADIRLPATRVRMTLSLLYQLVRQLVHRLGLVRRPRVAAKQEAARLSAHLHTRLAEHAYFMSNALSLVHGTLTALNEAESVRSVPEMIESYGGLAIGLGTAGLHAAARYYRDRSIAVARDLGELDDQGFAQLLATVYSFQSGNWPAARAHGAAGQAIYQRLGDHFRLQSCCVVDSFAAIATGDYAHAESALGMFGPDAEAVDNAPVRAWVLAGMSVLDMLQGRPPARTLARMQAARDETLHRAERLLCDGLESAARLQAGDADGALRVADRALDTMQESVCTMGIAMFSVCAVAEVHLVLLERALLRGAPHAALLARTRAACRAVRKYAAQTRICRPRALLLAGRLAMIEASPRRAATRFRRALADAERLAMPLEIAMCRLALAHRSLAEAGADQLRALGADPWRYGPPAASPPPTVAGDALRSLPDAA